jgi:hypothetical protein
MPYERLGRENGRIDFNHFGRMISATKRGPEGHVCVFNANIVTKDLEKVWFGDLDLTAEAEDLQWYANHLKTDIFVMREMDARFLREGEKINLSRAVATYAPQR